MTSARSLTAFFVLTLVLALPSYIGLGLTARGLILSPDVAVLFVPLVTLAPLVAALILTFREGGWAHTKALLWRAFDYERTTRKGWLVVALVLPPLIVLIAWCIAKMLGLEPLPAQAPFLAAPLFFLVFFGPALAEELGWMGYAYPPMEQKWRMFKSAVILGLIIAAFHLPLYYFLIDDPVILAIQTLFPVALRVLVVWIYSNAGKSIFAATVFHAAYNTAYSVFEVNIPVATALSILFALAAVFHGSRNAPHV